MGESLEVEVAALARQIAAHGAGSGNRVFRSSWWSDRLLQQAMGDAAFRTQLFRFVDVFPATTGSADVLRHLQEYFDDASTPKPLRLALGLAEALPTLGAPVAARVAGRNIRRMAGQFIVGADVHEAVAALASLWASGSAATVDFLGEKTVVDDEADRYAVRVELTLRALLAAAPTWPSRPVLEGDDLGALARVNVSVKPSALTAEYGPLTAQAGLAAAKDRIRPLLRLARDGDAFVNFDMEHYEVKDLTLQLFRELLTEEEFAGLAAGIVVQAYLRDSAADLAELIAWSGRRAAPVTVRLVKGAYWDTETVVAEAAGWAVPVFEDKAHTDANYERCVRLLHDAHGSIRAAFASHNLRSLAHAIVTARRRGIGDGDYELQVLAGMGEPIRAALCTMGFRTRVYTPVGELVPGMAYLVRRLLENTSNESFVRQRAVEGRALDELLAPSSVARLPEPAGPQRRPATDAAAPQSYRPEATAEWRRAPVRSTFGAAVRRRAGALGLAVPAVIGGERVRTARAISSVDPARPDVVVATSASCGRAEAGVAVAGARRVAERWQRTPVAERAAVLFRAAEWLRARRAEVAALEVFEAAKPWAEADADVCEAIDFCEYYARAMLALDGGAQSGDNVQSPPGERNRLTYQGKGVVAVIAPWNFPLAIPCGMTVAALVAGNAVLLKPAEQTPAIAYRLVEALEAGGLPPGVLSYLPGVGEEVGAALVEHPDVDVVVFTGSRPVGLAINATAAVPQPGQRSVKRVVAEMGGKNALVIDSDADLDVAVPVAIQSAFGYSGQKCSACSRLVVLDPVYDQVVERLVGAAAQLHIGHPAHRGTELGPLIDDDAHKRVTRYAELAFREGRVRVARDDVPGAGFFVGPVVVEGLDPSTSRVAREEIFGPVLAVFRAETFDHALVLANDTDFALTAGVISRSPANILRATHQLRAGNVYLNRSTTGAVVGRQPFGGYGMSGVGSKAGGPDYLLQFLDPRTVTENTLRQGFAPEG